MKLDPVQARLLSRRGLLKNAAVMTILAPVLRQQAVQAAVSPSRLILLVSPNGPMVRTGPASGTETDFTLSDWWKPLEPFKADGVFMSHMSITGGGVVGGGGHGLGGQVYSGGGANVYAQRERTIDSIIAERLVKEGRAGIKSSVVWGSASNGSGGGTGDFFSEIPGKNVSPQLDPSKAWAELFAGFTAPLPDENAKRRAEALIAREQSVLGFVNDDCDVLKNALGAEGTRLLQQHCSTLRTMEQNLTRDLSSGAAGMCRKPGNPGNPAANAWSNPENVEAQCEAFFELMAATLACELSHVIAFQFGAQAARNRLATKFGVPTSPKADSGDSGPAHHPWTHQGNSENKVKALGIFTSHYAKQTAVLLDKLKKTVDVNGKPLLASTMVISVCELGGNDKGSEVHQTSSLPVMVFGGTQSGIKTGRYLRGKSPELGNSGAAYTEAGRDTARLLVSAMHHMGLKDVNTVGRTGVNGPLPSLYG